MATLKPLIFATILLSVSLLTACQEDISTAKNTLIQGLPPPSESDIANLPKIRYAVIQETATSLGAQSGLAWASRRINKSLELEELHLNQVFNFRMLLINRNVLPPVLAEGDNSVAVDGDGDTALRIADKTYKIESPPRFVSAPPTWREYLWMNYTAPERPNIAMLPKKSDEKKVWDEFYAIGWKEGVNQANAIFTENMGRLKRDYEGMILYRKLLAQGIVTAPFVAKSDLGVTGDANQIRINDQVLRITATSRLVPNSRQWKAVVVPGTEAALRQQGVKGNGSITVEN